MLSSSFSSKNTEDTSTAANIEDNFVLEEESISHNSVSISGGSSLEGLESFQAGVLLCP